MFLIFGPCQPPRLFSGKESLADPQVLLFWECLLPTFRQQQLWEEERKIVSISYFHEDSFQHLSYFFSGHWLLFWPSAALSEEGRASG